MTPPLYEPNTHSPMAPACTSPLPLFQGNPDPLEVRQQRLTNCPLPAILSAVAHACPEQIRHMILLRKAPTQSWFFGKPLTSLGFFQFDTNYMVKFQHKAVDVTPFLYFDSSNHPRFAMSTNGAGWVSYIEKAYVVYRGAYHYENLDFLGAANPILVERVMEDIVHEFDNISIDQHGRGKLLRDLESSTKDPPENESEEFSTLMWQNLDAQDMKRLLRTFLGRSGRRATIATTDSHNAAHSASGLVGMHTYSVLSYSRRLNRIVVFDAMHGRTVNVTLANFIAAFDNLYQARSHGLCQ